jgi:phage shock protein C
MVKNEGKMQKRLYRSRTDRIIWGVCGGLAKYLDLDPIIIRLAFVFITLAGGAGILAYIIMAIIVPLEGSGSATAEETVKQNVTEIRDTANQLGKDLRATFSGETRVTEDTAQRGRRLTTLGIIIIALGIILLLSNLNLFWWFNWRYFWPGILILIGIFIIVRALRK